LINEKLELLKKETEDLISKCADVGDEKTVQLLSEIAEMLDIAHNTHLGNALSSLTSIVSKELSKK
jgi:hypothetical protein